MEIGDWLAIMGFQLLNTRQYEMVELMNYVFLRS